MIKPRNEWTLFWMGKPDGNIVDQIDGPKFKNLYAEVVDKESYEALREQLEELKREVKIQTSPSILIGSREKLASAIAAIGHLRSAGTEVLNTYIEHTIHEDTCHCSICVLKHAMAATEGFADK